MILPKRWTARRELARLRVDTRSPRPPPAGSTAVGVVFCSSPVLGTIVHPRPATLARNCGIIGDSGAASGVVCSAWVDVPRDALRARRAGCPSRPTPLRCRLRRCTIIRRSDRPMQIQLLSFPGCPHVGAARHALAEALRDVGVAVPIVEIEVTAAGTPLELRGWGSPTILVDGVDVVGGAPSGSCCRLYPGSDRAGVPPLTAIVTALRSRLREAQR